MLGKAKIRVRCPKCGAIRCVWIPVKSVKCFKCNKTFKIVYKKPKKGKVHNIIDIEIGSLRDVQQYVSEMLHS